MIMITNDYYPLCAKPGKHWAKHIVCTVLYNFIFWPRHTACGSQLPVQGSWQWKWSPNHWTAREFPVLCNFSSNPVTLMFFFFFNWNIEIYNVVIVSAAQQSESAPCIHDFPLFWISFPFRSQGHWAEFPVLNRRFSLVQFSHSVVSESLQPHGLQHARLPCPSPTPRAYSNSCPLSQWCHPTISSSVIPFSSFLQYFPASGSFPRSQFFASGGQSTVASASASVLPMNIQDWFPLGWTGLDLLAVQETLKSLLQHHSSKASILRCSAFFIVQLSYPYMTTGKTLALTRQTFVDKVMALLFNMLSGLVITFLPRSKRLLISRLQSPSRVTLEPPKIKSATVSTVSPYICNEVMGPDGMILVFWMLSWSQLFHSSLSLSSRGSLVPLRFLP